MLCSMYKYRRQFRNFATMKMMRVQNWGRQLQSHLTTRTKVRKVRICAKKFGKANCEFLKNLKSLEQCLKFPKSLPCSCCCCRCIVEYPPVPPGQCHVTMLIHGVLSVLLLILLKSVEGLLSLVATLVFVFPVLCILWTVNTCSKFAISILLWARALTSGGAKFQLSTIGLDNIWGYQIPGNSRNVLFVTVYAKLIDAQAYRGSFEEKVIGFKCPRTGAHPYKKLKQIFTRSLGYYCWKEDLNFDIDNHIVIYPQNQVFDKVQLLELLSRLAGDFSEEHPQWQEIIIPKYKDSSGGSSGSGSAASLEQDENANQEQLKEAAAGVIKTLRILRFHHSYGDAGSWLLLYSYCMANGQIPYSVNPLEGFPIPRWKLCLYYVNILLFGFATSLRAVWNGRQAGTGAAAEASSASAAGGGSRLVTKYYNGQKYFDWSDMVALQLLKDIKLRTRTSIATILASVIGGALRKFDERFPRKQVGIGQLVDLGFVAAILPYPSLRLMNRFTIANMRIPTHSNRLLRLQETHAIGMALARSPEPMINYWMFSFFGTFPIFVQNLLMKSAGTALVFSNLPGASETFHLHGDAIDGGGAWVPLLTCAGLSLSACGYKNELRLCGVTDSATMSKQELKFVLGAIIEEIRLLAHDTVGIV